MYKMPKNIQPRVLSYGEAHKLKRNDFVFLEYTGFYTGVLLAVVAKPDRCGLVFQNTMPCLWDSYGTIPKEQFSWGWRLWTDEPTEEQRKAVSWKGA